MHSSLGTLFRQLGCGHQPICWTLCKCWSSSDMPYNDWLHISIIMFCSGDMEKKMYLPHVRWMELMHIYTWREGAVLSSCQGSQFWRQCDLMESVCTLYIIFMNTIMSCMSLWIFWISFQACRLSNSFRLWWWQYLSSLC
jgi:hypothetical protein